MQFIVFQRNILHIFSVTEYRYRGIKLWEVEHRFFTNAVTGGDTRAINGVQLPSPSGDWSVERLLSAAAAAAALASRRRHCSQHTVHHHYSKVSYTLSTFSLCTHHRLLPARVAVSMAKEPPSQSAPTCPQTKFLSSIIGRMEWKNSDYTMVSCQKCWPPKLLVIINNFWWPAPVSK